MVRLCPYSTKTPDHRDVTEVAAPGSTDDALDLEYPWIILAIVHLGAGQYAWHKHHKVGSQISN